MSTHGSMQGSYPPPKYGAYAPGPQIGSNNSSVHGSNYPTTGINEPSQVGVHASKAKKPSKKSKHGPK